MAMDYGDESDHHLISTEMLEDIRDGSQTHPDINRRDARYKIRDRIKQRQPEWKVALKSMLRVDFNATFHSDCLCLIRSRIL